MSRGWTTAPHKPGVRANIGDVVQLNPELVNPSFAGAFMIVEKVRDWGVQGCIMVPMSPESRMTYLRVDHQDYVVIGRYVWWPRLEADE